MYKNEISASPIRQNSGYDDINIIVSVNNHCPWCNELSTDLIQDAYYDKYTYGADDRYNFTVVLHCPGCHKISMLEYNHVQAGKRAYGRFDLSQYPYTIIPSPHSVSAFPAQIQKLSPNFIEIYNQSEKAENDGYTEICGMGYRKALEFLVKDYLIHCDQEREKEIIEKPLAAAIRDINDDTINTIAIKAAWLGNDESHYFRKHPEYDFHTLKKFITTVSSLINWRLDAELAKQIT